MKILMYNIALGQPFFSIFIVHLFQLRFPFLDAAKGYAQHIWWKFQLNVGFAILMTRIGKEVEGERNRWGPSGTTHTKPKVWVCCGPTIGPTWGWPAGAPPGPHSVGLTHALNFTPVTRPTVGSNFLPTVDPHMPQRGRFARKFPLLHALNQASLIHSS